MKIMESKSCLKLQQWKFLSCDIFVWHRSFSLQTSETLRSTIPKSDTILQGSQHFPAVGGWQLGEAGWSVILARMLSTRVCHCSQVWNPWLWSHWGADQFLLTPPRSCQDDQWTGRDASIATFQSSHAVELHSVRCHGGAESRVLRVLLQQVGISAADPIAQDGKTYKTSQDTLKGLNKTLKVQGGARNYKVIIHVWSKLEGRWSEVVGFLETVRSQKRELIWESERDPSAVMLCSDRWKWGIWSTKGISFADQSHIVTSGGIMMDPCLVLWSFECLQGLSGPWVWNLTFQRCPRCHRIRHPGSRDFLCSHGSCSGSRDHGGRTSWVPLPRHERSWKVNEMSWKWSTDDQRYTCRTVVTLHKKMRSTVVLLLKLMGHPMHRMNVRNSLYFSVIFQAIRKHGYQQPTPIQVQLQMAGDCCGFNFDHTDQNSHCDQGRLLSNCASTALQFPLAHFWNNFLKSLVIR